MNKRKEKETMISSVQIPFSSHYFDNAGIENVPLVPHFVLGCHLNIHLDKKKNCSHLSDLKTNVIV